MFIIINFTAKNVVFEKATNHFTKAYYMGKTRRSQPYRTVAAAFHDSTAPKHNKQNTVSLESVIQMSKKCQIVIKQNYIINQRVNFDTEKQEYLSTQVGVKRLT